MPRIARTKGEFSTYHVILRGNERKSIFISDDDRLRFLDTLRRMKEKYNFNLEAYCMMDNHVHLLINDNGNDISSIIKSLNISYAYYFNRNYKRVGHLFQDRFKSEIVDNDKYLVAASAYIHNNPVKAGIVTTPEQYIWSSYNFYIGQEISRSDLVDTDRILGMFSNSRQKAAEEYHNYVLEFEPKTEIIDIEEDRILFKRDNVGYIESYECATRLIEEELLKKGKNAEEIKKDKDLRRELIIRLRKNSLLTLREIGELCGGLSQSMVCKILKS